MTPEERIAKAFHDYQFGPYNLEQYLADAIRAAEDAERARIAATLRATKARLQEDGAVWWNVGALDEFIRDLSE